MDNSVSTKPCSTWITATVQEQSGGYCALAAIRLRANRLFDAGELGRRTGLRLRHPHRQRVGPAHRSRVPVSGVEVRGGGLPETRELAVPRVPVLAAQPLPVAESQATLRALTRPVGAVAHGQPGVRRLRDVAQAEGVTPLV